MTLNNFTNSFLIFVAVFTLVGCKSNDITPNATKPVVVVTSDSILKISPDGVFTRNNKPYKGIGVNYFNAFYRTILNQSDKSYYEGLKYLSDNKIPFIRFNANGFWPNELKLYQTNKTRYFTLLDEFVKTAERYRVGLIPSLFWFYAAVPDLMGEHVNQWGNPNSKTIAFMRTYTAEVVDRYKNSPAIWGWEFGNEVNSYLDLLGVVFPDIPAVNAASGTPATRTADDAITTEIFQYALSEFAAVVRKYDSERAIFSGNGVAGTNSYHRYKYKNWEIDSSTEYRLLLDVQNPVSLGTLTIHLYPHQDDIYFSDFKPKATLSQIIRESMRASKELKRPFFLGEFGSPKTLGETTEAKKFKELLDAIVENEVQLSALWVYDFSYQDKDWNITPTNNRKYQLDAIIKINSQF